MMDATKSIPFLAQDNNLLLGFCLEIAVLTNRRENNMETEDLPLRYQSMAGIKNLESQHVNQLINMI